MSRTANCVICGKMELALDEFMIFMKIDGISGGLMDKVYHLMVLVDLREKSPVTTKETDSTDSESALVDEWNVRELRNKNEFVMEQLEKQNELIRKLQHDLKSEQEEAKSLRKQVMNNKQELINQNELNWHLLQELDHLKIYNGYVV